ncbi:MAG TPA: aminotransferase class I/II-fold pyridoxal phosphate-dependent enzyme [Burkholderiaceae bacterium]
MDFLEDDYDAINSEYFQEVRLGGPFLDPSGWLDTASDALALLPPHQFDSSRLQSYYGDLSDHLGAPKDKLRELLETWDECTYSMDNLTICQSATAASLLVLAFLKSTGIRSVLFESPCYYASLEQCHNLGMYARRIRTSEADNYKLTINEAFLDGASPCALWLTQPRIGLGSDQDAVHVRHMLEMLPADGFLVLDEAVEQCFPSILRELNPSQMSRVIKIRSMLKPCGLNGIRISFVLHNEKYRKNFAQILELYNPTIDCFSLSYAMQIAERPLAFKAMLDAARLQTSSLAKRAAALADGSHILVHQLVTGYIGSLAIDLGTRTVDDYMTKRRELLLQCRNHRLPVILGASMHFPLDPQREYVRLNFFNREHHILGGVEKLMAISNLIYHDRVFHAR